MIGQYPFFICYTNLKTLMYNTQNNLSQTDAKIQQLKRQIQQQTTCYSLGSGRGGNNMCENVKKSLLSIIRRTITTSSFEQLKHRFIIQHGLKSQKENTSLIFMFLTLLLKEGKVTQEQYETVLKTFKLKLQVFIKNSMKKIEASEQRIQFHQKNIRQFKKFMDAPIDFRHPVLFSSISTHLGSFYLRKKIEFEKSLRKTRGIILQYPVLQSLIVETVSDI